LELRCKGLVMRETPPRAYASFGVRETEKPCPHRARTGLSWLRLDVELEVVPEELVVDVVVELDLGGFDDRAEETGAAIG